ncbi:MAG: threonine/serine dehydratase [Pseudomonadota bacterium]
MNIDEIHAAAARAAGHVRRTPMLTSPFLDEIAGRRIWVKAECLQHTGSFKFRGAWSAVSSLSDEEREKGIFASSSGNHAQAIALAARMHGAVAVILMPSDAPKLKIANTEALGAEVVLYDRETEDREVLAPRLATQRQLTFIPPFDHPMVIAGQGTCGLEIDEQAPEGADLLVCCSGGGLTSGIALALEGTGRRIHPVEPEGFDDVARSLISGTRERNDRTSGSICDAIITPQAGELTWSIIQRLCAPGIVVTEEEALRAMALAWLRLKIVVEPGGAVALAAALFHGDEIEGDDVALTVSGGNVDADIFRRALDTL